MFFVFRDSYDLCMYVMNILYTFHISVSWVCYRLSTRVGYCRLPHAHKYKAPLKIEHSDELIYIFIGIKSKQKRLFRCWMWLLLYHYYVVPAARISLTFSRHFIASGRSSGLHPVSSHSCCMYVLAGRPAFSWPYVGVHKSTSLMSLSLILQQCPACLVR